MVSARRDSRRRYGFAVGLALIVWFLFQVAFATTGLFRASTAAMEETVLIDDRMLVVDEAGGERGDMVLHSDPRRANIDCSSHLFLRRVVGLEGERVEITGGRVVVDGQTLEEPYLPAGAQQPDFAAVTVPDNAVFFLGDNRSIQQDSRLYGSMPNEAICGWVILVLDPAVATLVLLVLGMVMMAVVVFWALGIRRLLRLGYPSLGWLAIAGAALGILVPLVLATQAAFTTAVALVGFAGWLLPPKPEAKDLPA